MRHPEWTGDWQMPEGVQQADIDPTTGQLAKADTTTKRAELLLAGPCRDQKRNDATDETAQEPPAQIDGDEKRQEPSD